MINANLDTNMELIEGQDISAGGTGNAHAQIPDRPDFLNAYSEAVAHVVENVALSD